MKFKLLQALPKSRKSNEIIKNYDSQLSSPEDIQTQVSFTTNGNNQDFYDETKIK